MTIPLQLAEVQVGLTSIAVSARGEIQVGKTKNIFSALPAALWTPGWVF